MTRTTRCGVTVVVLSLAAIGACSSGSDDADTVAVTAETSAEDTSTDGTTTTSPAMPSTVPTTTTSPAETTTTTTTTTTTPPPLIAGIAVVDPIGPIGETVEVPEFVWSPVDGATSYQLVVRTADGPVWAWEGPESSIWLGGFGVEPPPGVSPVSIVDESCWSVVAVAADGTIAATSPLVAIAPGAPPTHTC